MTGDSVQMSMNENQKFTYEAKISRWQHVPNNPHLKCKEYTLKNSYNDCAKDDLLSFFREILGCQPPFLENNPNNVCNKRFNISKDKEMRLKTLTQLLYYQDVRFNCEIPCTRNKYSTRLLHNEPISGKKLRIVFAKTVNVDRSVYSIDSQTFLTRLGGSVSTGRTLLWILLTLLGAFQVNPLVIFSTWKILILRFCAFYVSELFSGDKQTSGAKSFLAK